MDMTTSGLKSIKTAVINIEKEICTRVDLGNNTIVYKVPSSNPSKYTIRIDIRVNTEEK